MKFENKELQKAYEDWHKMMITPFKEIVDSIDWEKFGIDEVR